MNNKKLLILELNDLIHQKNYQKAVLLAAELVKSFPDEPAVFATAGIALAMLGRHDTALKYFFHTVTLQPLHAGANVWIARLIADRPDPEKQLQIFRKWESILKRTLNLKNLQKKLFSHYRRESDADFWRVVSIFSRMYMEINRTKDALDSFYCAVKRISNKPTKAADPATIDDEYASYDYDKDPMHTRTADDFSKFVSKNLVNCSNLTILDAACGSGLAARYLRPFAKTLLGFDISKSMSTRAKKKKLYDAVSIGDIRKKNIICDNADVVHCLGATYYISDLQPFFSACSSVMKPGSFLLFTDYPSPPEIAMGQTISPTTRYCRSDQLTIATAKKNGFSLNKRSYGLVYGIPSHYWSFQRS